MKSIELLSGDQMPILGLGTWKMSPAEAYESVKMAIRNGYRHIDCAWIYQNESSVGRAITELLDSGEISREELWITSKLWNDRHHPEHVRDALKGTPSDLRLDYLDLYLIHWPVAHEFGVPRAESGNQMLSLDEVPLSDTWSAMLECVESGLCRNTGVSNFNQPKLQNLIDVTGQTPACNQVECHPYLQQDDLLDYCLKHQIAFTAYSPLGSGDRPELMRKDGDPNLFDDPLLKTMADQHQVTVAQLMLAWAIQRGSAPIPKSNNEARQNENLAAAKIVLSNADLETLKSLDQNYRYNDGSYWAIPGSPYTVDDLWNH